MFTGIIEEVGRLKSLISKGEAMEIVVEAAVVLEGTKLGDSIATNGVCLTVTEMGDDYFKADMMPQTAKLTNLHRLRPGSPVNLERAIQVGGRLGGHIVQGHVDGMGKLISIRPVDQAHVLTFEAKSSILELMVDRGSVALDGISLTIVEVHAHTFSVSIIPTTGKESQILDKQQGDLVNIETDIIGKYVKGLVEHKKNSGITEHFLAENGFL